MSSTDPRVARPENADQPVTITITWDEASHLADGALPLSNDRAATVLGPFEDPTHYYDRTPHQNINAANQILSSPAFANGCVLTAESYLAALILAKLHTAHGYEAHVLVDLSDTDHSSNWVVATTWDCVPDVSAP